MARNVEIKARVIDPEQLHARVRDTADDGPLHITQDDTFFTCPNGSSNSGLSPSLRATHRVSTACIP